MKILTTKKLPPLYLTLADRCNPDLGYWQHISTPEQRFIDALERFGADLPHPVCEYRFAYPRKWRADFAWTAKWLLVEVDGGTHKAGGGRHAQDADREKLNQAAILGFCVLRFSSDMLFADPEACIQIVRRALVLGDSR
jgi:hypothetical protein